MNTRRLLSSAAIAAAAAVGFAAITAVPAAALTKSEMQCATAKLSSIGKEAVARLKCEAKAVQASTNVDAGCLSTAADKRGTAFEKAELKGGCLSSADTAFVGNSVTEFVDRMVMYGTVGDPLPACSALFTGCGTCGDGVCVLHGTNQVCVSQGSVNDGLGCTSDSQCSADEYCLSGGPGTQTLCGGPCGTPPSPGPLDKAARVCASSKLKAGGKKLKSVLKCHTQAIGQATNVDSECLTKAEGKFTDAFAKADEKGGCVATGDGPMIESVVDDMVAQMVDLQTVLHFVDPLPACSVAGSTCGTCEGGGYCIDHVPSPGCVATAMTSFFPCETDAGCVPGTYCMHVFDWPVIFPFPFPDLPEWICMDPCP